MQRRDLLKSLVAGTLCSALPGSIILAPSSHANASKPARAYPWKNWSGNQHCHPKNKFAPSSISDLQDIIRSQTGNIRCVGSGHSFSALVPTDDTLISLSRLKGLAIIEDHSATFNAGTTLRECGPLLEQYNQALINMPDVDYQTLAGAISTATHGTGRNLGSLSGDVESIKLITAQGDELSCNASLNPEIFQAAQVSLGSLGVITEVEIRTQAAYRLKRESYWQTLSETLDATNELSKKNRHFEFFYFPFTGMTLLDTLNITEDDIQHNQELDGNSGIMDLKSTRDYLSWSPKLRELIVGSYLKTQAPGMSIDKSFEIFANDRNVRFNEMEYHLPIENGLLALSKIIQHIEKHFPEAFFPIECRYVKSEEAWLSPFYQQDTFSIALHTYFEEDHHSFFKALEPILQAYGGRPHWGKINSLNTQQAAQVYPKWNDFLTLRQELDPEGKFINPYLKKLFSLATS